MIMKKVTQLEAIECAKIITVDTISPF